MIRWGVLLLCLLPLWPQVAFSQNYSPAFIIQAFNEIALKNEYSLQGNAVRKWQQPISVWIDHQVPDQEIHTRLVKMHLDHLTEITGHPIALVNRKTDANLTIVFTRQSKWRQEVAKQFGQQAASHTHGAVCMANFRTRGNFEIKSAGVIIPVDQARMHGKLVSCIVEELTQVMGLPNDSEKVFPSIFNDKTPEELLTGLDYLLLKALYNPAMKVGMDRSGALPVLHKLTRRWLKQGTIQSANKDVKRGELYTLLGY